MTIDLSAIDARLAWAHGHAERVRRLSEEWGSQALRTSTEEGPTPYLAVHRAEVVGAPSADIALALGDVLQHGRATLDNLVGVLRGGATDLSQFRIDTDPAVFDADANRRLDGVPAWAIAVFRRLQPFPDNAWRGVGDALAHLHHLAIADRHRALLLAGAVIDMDGVWVATDKPGTEFRVREGGRVLEVTYPLGAQVSPHIAAAVLVQEERLRWPDGHYPLFPEASDVAKQVLWGVGQVVDQVKWAAAQVSQG